MCFCHAVYGQWPIPYRRYKSRPISNSYCKAGVIPFCPTGQIANSMPKFKPDDKVQLYALKKPVWQFKFGDTLGKFHIMHDALGISNLNTGMNYTMEWYELFQLFNCTFPHVVNDSLLWCNQGAACIYGGIEDRLWKENGTLQLVATTNGDVFNQFAEWVLWDNTTGLYYETWTVRDKPDGKMWFDSFDCASWVLRAFQEFGKLGVKFDQTVKLNYTRINLFSDMPKYLGNQSMVFANKTLGNDIMKFYSKFQAHVAGPLLIEHLISALEEILIQNKFYFFYNEEYWFLPMKSPHVKLTYNEIPLPS